MSTNFSGKLFTNWNDLITFSDTIKFPSHAIILRKDSESSESIFKGITSIEELKSQFNLLINKFGCAYAETDMRAMYNPTRMVVIETAFKKLLNKINSSCPKCKAIGFDVASSKSGLPCSLCGFKTQSTLSHTYTCNKCGYQEEKMFPNNVISEDPMYCGICNP